MRKRQWVWLSSAGMNTAVHRLHRRAPPPPPWLVGSSPKRRRQMCWFVLCVCI
ncbi:hypothetical protein Hanom_Chr06g00525411 [Helianthus anomalus]